MEFSSSGREERRGFIVSLMISASADWQSCYTPGAGAGVKLEPSLVWSRRWNQAWRASKEHPSLKRSEKCSQPLGAPESEVYCKALPLPIIFSPKCQASLSFVLVQCCCCCDNNDVRTKIFVFHLQRLITTEPLVPPYNTRFHECEWSKNIPITRWSMKCFLLHCARAREIFSAFGKKPKRKIFCD